MVRRSTAERFVGTVCRPVARYLPRRSDYAGLRTSWRGDLIAGATVGVVALPLALAFGITAGLGVVCFLLVAAYALTGIPMSPPDLPLRMILGAWLIALALRTNRAQVRYWVWFTASAKFLIPFSLLVGLGTLMPHHAATPAVRTE